MGVPVYMWVSVLSEVLALILCGVIIKGFPQLGVGPNPAYWFIPVGAFALAGLFFFLNLLVSGFTVSVFLWIGLVTVGSLVYGVAILQEPINLHAWIGFGLIIAGVLLVQLNAPEA